MAVSNIPKYDGYHFREDTTHRAAFANVLAHRARCVQAEASLSSLSEENIKFLQEAYPFDRYGERVYRMTHVFDRALFNAQYSRRLFKAGRDSAGNRGLSRPLGNGVGAPSIGAGYRVA